MEDKNNLRKIFLILVGLAYIGMGIFIYFEEIIPSSWNGILATLFIVYGGWRLYRALM